MTTGPTIPISAALEAILAKVQPVGAVSIDLATAVGRILRQEVRADLDSPPFDASAMDGYAARRADLALPLRVAGELQAGAIPSRPVNAGECIRIFTGAALPPGADCVVKQEDATREGDALRVQKRDAPDYIRRRGENRRGGDIILPAGTRLGPPELAILASVGAIKPEVSRRVRCVHLVMGNELVAPDRTPAGAQIRDSNSALVAALLNASGAELVGHALVRDDLPAAQATVEKMPEHDVLFISGGSSVGDHDLARPLLTALGYTVHFDAVNLRPGKPLGFASRDRHLAFALPGNPVPHWVVFHLFVAPALRQLETGRAAPSASLRGRLAAEGRLPPSDNRQTYWPCRAVVANGAYELTPLRIASSGDSSGLVGANALLRIPPPPATLAPGQEVEFLLCR